MISPGNVRLCLDTNNIIYDKTRMAFLLSYKDYNFKKYPSHCADQRIFIV